MISGLFKQNYAVESSYTTGGNFREALSIGHQIQVMICLNIKLFENLIQKMSMLRRRNNTRVQPIAAFHLFYYGSHFDRLRTCADYDQRLQEFHAIMRPNHLCAAYIRPGQTNGLASETSPVAPLNA